MTGRNTALANLGWTPFYQQQLSTAELASTEPARVSAVHRGGVEIIAPVAETPSVIMLPPAFLEDAEEDRPTVGDWLLLDPQTHTPLRRLARVSLLKRLAPGNRVQLIAANVDTLFITSSCNEDFNLSRLERYLSLASDAGANPVIVLTKADLADDTEQLRQQAAALMPGLPVLCINATQPSGVAALLEWCGKGQTVALVGSSGTGKSTLVNTLIGHDRQATQAIREDDSKGRHTTTGRSLHALPSGGWIIDTPGMRELGLTDTEEGITDVFAEIEELASQCRFSDCGHQNEPGCAITAALESGQLDPRRWRNFTNLRAEETRNTATVAQRRKRGRGLSKMYRAAQNRKRRGK